jgi:hypothetical protein
MPSTEAPAADVPELTPASYQQPMAPIAEDVPAPVQASYATPASALLTPEADVVFVIEAPSSITVNEGSFFASLFTLLSSVPSTEEQVSYTQATTPQLSTTEQAQDVVLVFPTFPAFTTEASTAAAYAQPMSSQTQAPADVPVFFVPITSTSSSTFPSLRLCLFLFQLLSLRRRSLTLSR